MTDNPFLNSQSDSSGRVIAPKGMSKAEREQFWIARGNRILWGEEPCQDGSYLDPRRNLEWRCKDGHYFIAEIGR